MTSCLDPTKYCISAYSVSFLLQETMNVLCFFDEATGAWLSNAASLGETCACNIQHDQQDTGIGTAAEHFLKEASKIRTPSLLHSFWVPY